MNIDTKTLAFATIFASALFLIFNSENIHFGTYGQVSENISNSTSITSNGNLTGTENITGSNTTNSIPYVLNVTNSSDISSQAVDQVKHEFVICLAAAGLKPSKWIWLVY